MPSASRRRSHVVKHVRPVVLERELQRRVLKQQLKIEREVQRLTTQLQREIQKSNDRLQALGIALASRSRAIEAERESEHALRG